MDIDQILVTIIGIFLSLSVIWYFFLYKKETVKASEIEGGQEININVKGGYDPELIIVKKGKPVKLNFYREETSACSETVVFPDFRIRQDLPAFKTTIIEINPEQPGEFEFHCDMNMLHGKLIVQ